MGKAVIENYSLPINDYELDEINVDERFTKVKVFVAHTGENLKHTHFSISTLNKMKDSLANIPIVGYLSKDEYGDIDFKGHERRLVIDENGIEMDYLGVPFGLIPESNNAQIEFREGREWLTVEGYLWNKFPKALSVFSNSGGRKSHSMELLKMEGNVDSSGIFRVESAVFDALCALGDDVQSAMIGSTIDILKDNQEYSTELSGVMKELMEEMAKEFSTKGVDKNMPKELEDHLDGEQTEKQTEAQEPEKVEDDNEQGVDEPVKQGEEEDKEKEEKDEQEPVEAKEPEVVDPSNPDATPTGENVNLGTSQTPGVGATMPTGGPTGVPNSGTTETSTSQADYAEENEVLKAEVEALQGKVDELTKFYNSKVLEEKQAVLNSYSDELSKEELEKFANDINNYTKEELEKEIVFTVYKKEKTEENTQPSFFSFSPEKESKKSTSGEFGIFDKYFE